MKLQKYWEQVKKLPNVNGYSGSLKPRIKDGKVLENTKVFRVYVEKKLPFAELLLSDMIPMKLKGGVETDVCEIGFVQAPPPEAEPFDASYLLVGGEEDNPQKRYRPYPAGVSAMNYQGTACSLGFYATRDDELFIIANNHCSCRENKAEIGENYIQPSAYDNGKNPQDRIGKLVDWVELKFNEFACPYRNFFHRMLNLFRESSSNKVDVGLVSVDYVEDAKPEILNIGKVYGKRDPIVGDVCMKCGRTTGLTKDGPIIDTDWNGSIQYSRGIAFFEDCFLIAKAGFSAGGDSSSAIVTQEDEPKFLGLLFAGSDQVTIFCKQSNIEDELNVEIIA